MKNNTTLKLGLLAMLGSGFLTFSLYASPPIIIDADFEDDTAGNAPITSIETNPLVHPTFINQAGGSNIVISNNYTPGSITLPGNSMIFNNPTNSNPYVNFKADTNDFTANLNYKISMDLLFDPASDYANQTLMIRFFNNETETWADYQAYAYFAGQNAGVDRIVLNPGYSGGTYFNLPSGMITNLMHVEFTLDYGSNSFSATINSNFIGSVNLDAESPKGFNTIQFIRTADTAFSVGIDNVHAIPESSTGVLSLLALSLVGGLLLYKRKTAH